MTLLLRLSLTKHPEKERDRSGGLKERNIRSLAKYEQDDLVVLE